MVMEAAENKEAVEEAQPQPPKVTIWRRDC